MDRLEETALGLESMPDASLQFFENKKKTKIVNESSVTKMTKTVGRIQETTFVYDFDNSSVSPESSLPEILNLCKIVLLFLKISFSKTALTRKTHCQTAKKNEIS